MVDELDALGSSIWEGLRCNILLTATRDRVYTWTRNIYERSEIRRRWRRQEDLKLPTTSTATTPIVAPELIPAFLARELIDTNELADANPARAAAEWDSELRGGAHSVDATVRGRGAHRKQWMDRWRETEANL